MNHNMRYLFHTMSDEIRQGWDFPNERVAHNIYQSEDAMIRALLKLKDKVEGILQAYDRGETWEVLNALTDSFGVSDRLSPIASEVSTNAHMMRTLCMTVTKKENAQ